MNRRATGRRDSLRLQTYDYAWPGSYFVTLCVADRSPRFGDVNDGEMRLNEAGRQIAAQWQALPERFEQVALDAYVVMPNHFHAILALTTTEPAGAAPLASVIQAFKSLTTRAYSAGVRAGDFPPFDRQLWQRSYYDHVIRDERDLERIRTYIESNPRHWFEDREYRRWREQVRRAGTLLVEDDTNQT